MNKRYFEFQEDDSTKFLNESLLAMLPSGVYRGFDEIESRNDLLVRVLHTTSAFAYDNANHGVFITKNGVKIYKDATVQIGTANPTTLKRIDLLVATHTYQDTVALGEQELYSIVQGVEHATTPVAPYANVPANGVVLGELHLPASCSALNQVGVEFKRTLTPLFANDNTRLALKANLVNGKVPLIELNQPDITKVFVYDTIAQRNADTIVWNGKKCYVKNATDDAEIGTNVYAEYVYLTPENAWFRVSKKPIKYAQFTNVPNFVSVKDANPIGITDSGIVLINTEINILSGFVASSGVSLQLSNAYTPPINFNINALVRGFDVSASLAKVAQAQIFTSVGGIGFLQINWLNLSENIEAGDSFSICLSYAEKQ